MCNTAFVGRNEKNEAGIQERHVAMETTAKGEQETQAQRGIMYCLERWTHIIVGPCTRRDFVMSMCFKAGSGQM